MESLAEEGVPDIGGDALTKQSSSATSIQAAYRGWQSRTVDAPRQPESQGEWGECTIYAFTTVMQAQLEIRYNTALDEAGCRTLLAAHTGNGGVWPDAVGDKINSLGRDLKVKAAAPRPELYRLRITGSKITDFDKLCDECEEMDGLGAFTVICIRTDTEGHQLHSVAGEKLVGGGADEKTVVAKNSWGSRNPRWDVTRANYDSHFTPSIEVEECWSTSLEVQPLPAETQRYRRILEDNHQTIIARKRQPDEVRRLEGELAAAKQTIAKLEARVMRLEIACPAEAEAIEAEEQALQEAERHAQMVRERDAEAERLRLEQVAARVEADANAAGLSVGQLCYMLHNGEVVLAKVDRFEGEKVVCRFPDGKYYFAGQTVAEAAEAQRKALEKQDEDDAKLESANEARATAATDPRYVSFHGAEAVAAETVCSVWLGGKQCAHGLKRFNVPKASFRCDGCGARMPIGSAAFGCRTCNLDACSSCCANLGQIEAASIETQAAAPARLSPMEERTMQMGMGR